MNVGDMYIVWLPCWEGDLGCWCVCRYASNHQGKRLKCRPCQASLRWHPFLGVPPTYLAAIGGSDTSCPLSHYIWQCDQFILPQSTMPNKWSKDDIDIESLVESVPLGKGLINGLQQLDRNELAVVLAYVANVANISTTVFKKTRIELPSFSAAKWSDFAKQFGLPQNVSRLKLEPFMTPRYRLPPSLHEAVFENAWH